MTHSSRNNLTDVYRIRFGFRTVKVDGTDFLINGKPFYFKGFGMHEDAEVRFYLNLLSRNPTKWSNRLKQFVGSSQRIV